VSNRDLEGECNREKTFGITMSWKSKLLSQLDETAFFPFWSEINFIGRYLNENENADFYHNVLAHDHHSVVCGWAG
jgi:hypothetical protein